MFTKVYFIFCLGVLSQCTFVYHLNLELGATLTLPTLKSPFVRVSFIATGMKLEHSGFN